MGRQGEGFLVEAFTWEGKRSRGYIMFCHLLIAVGFIESGYALPKVAMRKAIGGVGDAWW